MAILKLSNSKDRNRYRKHDRGKPATPLCLQEPWRAVVYIAHGSFCSRKNASAGAGFRPTASRPCLGHKSVLGREAYSDV